MVAARPSRSGPRSTHDPPPGDVSPPQPQFGPQPSYGQHLPPGRGSGGGSGNSSGGGGETPFSDAFDFSFSSYATPAVVKTVYIIVFVMSVLEYVGSVLWMWVAGLGTPLLAVPTLLVGWILPLAQVLGTRLGLEHYLATVRTAQEVRALRERADLWFRGARA